MAVQHINLFDPSLRPERRWLTLPVAIAGAVVLLMAMNLAAAGYREATLRAQARTAQTEAELLALARQPAMVAETAQREELQQLRDRLAQAKAFESQLAQMPASDAAPQLLESLAWAALPDVWVTGLQWESKEQRLDVEGRLLEAERLPAYLRRLEQQPAFKGVRFSQVQVGKSGLEPGSPAVAFQLRGQGPKGVAP